MTGQPWEGADITAACPCQELWVSRYVNKSTWQKGPEGGVATQIGPLRVSGYGSGGGGVIPFRHTM